MSRSFAISASVAAVAAAADLLKPDGQLIPSELLIELMGELVAGGVTITANFQG